MYSMWSPTTQYTRYTAKGRLSAHIVSYVDTISSVTDLNKFTEELI